MEFIVARTISVLFLLVLTLFFGTLPYWAILRRRGHTVSSRRETIIKYLNCFSGGVFLGTLFLHLLTEGSEEFEKYLQSVHYDSEYPFFNVIVIFGFFLIATIEYFAHFVLEKDQGFTTTRHAETNGHNEKEDSQLNGHARGSYGAVVSDSAIMTNSQVLSAANHNQNSNFSESVIFHGGNQAGPEHKTHDQENQCLPVPTTCATTFNIRGILLLLALSFHSIFDGLALGLQEKMSTMWQVFGAVVLHKCIVAFCLGLDIYETFPNKKMATLMMVIFSFVSPVGAFIGIAMTSGNIDEEAKLLSSGIMQGLSCGAFLYVTFLEILNKYWKDSGCRRSFLDIVFSFIGLVIMALLKIWD